MALEAPAPDPDCFYIGYGRFFYVVEKAGVNENGPFVSRAKAAMDLSELEDPVQTLYNAMNKKGDSLFAMWRPLVNINNVSRIRGSSGEEYLYASFVIPGTQENGRRLWPLPCECAEGLAKAAREDALASPDTYGLKLDESASASARERSQRRLDALDWKPSMCQRFKNGSSKPYILNPKECGFQQLSAKHAPPNIFEKVSKNTPKKKVVQKPYPEFLTENPPAKGLKRSITLEFEGEMHYIKVGKLLHVFEAVDADEEE